MVTRAQLLRTGITTSEIEQRLRTGALLREHRGIYRVGHRAPGVEASYLAAVRACGDGALLSGRAAGYLLGIVKGRVAAPEVTAPTERRVKGVKTRRSRDLAASDATTWRRIPVTSVARTLVDLAASLSTAGLARACHEAGVRHGTTPAQVDAVLARRPKSPGAVLRDARLVLPQTNISAGGRRVDCYWPQERLVVELDSYRYHSRHAWEQDRHREREARARCEEFRRHTYGDVFDEPQLMLAELRALVPSVDARYSSAKQ